MRYLVVGVGTMLMVLAGTRFGMCDGTVENRLSAIESEMEEMRMAAAEAAGAENLPGTFRAYWDKGLKFETVDKSFTLAIGGRAQIDFGFVHQDDESKAAFGNITDGAEFRRLRLEMGGRIYQNTGFKVQLDFAGGAVAIKDAYVELNNVPLLKNIRAGQTYEPFGLEIQTSSKYITFLERSQGITAFAPDRHIGIKAFSSELNDRMTWAAGVFRNNDAGTGALLSDEGYDLSGRITAVPYKSDDGRRMVHLGAAYSHRTTSDDMVRYRERPDYHLTSTRLVDTGSFRSDRQDLLGVEAAFICGPFALQGEYAWQWADRPAPMDAVLFGGYYVQASYFLTGETKKYDPKEGIFGRVSPKRNLGRDGGLGAWEVAVRVDGLDLNDDTIVGGEETNLTLGVNWHWNPNTRVMFNWVHADAEKGATEGDADFFITRFAVDF